MIYICQNIDPTLYARTGGLVDEFEPVFEGRVWYRYCTTLHTVLKLYYYSISSSFNSISSY